MLSAPITIASALAARTRRTKIGTAVPVLPLRNPVRIAEEIATLDHISQGRLDFGIGRSAFPSVYEGYRYGKRLFNALQGQKRASGGLGNGWHLKG